MTADILTTQQVADALGRSAGHVRALAARHGVGRQLDGRTRVYEAQDVDRIRALFKQGLPRRSVLPTTDASALSPDDDESDAEAVSRTA